MNIPSKQYRHLIECLESQRFPQYFNTSEMFIHLEKALSSSFPALYNEYTVYKIIDTWLNAHNAYHQFICCADSQRFTYIHRQFTSKIFIYLKTTLCRSFEASSRHRWSTAWQRMRICAANEKIGCSGVKILYITWEANVLKFTKNYNNDNDCLKFLWTLQKA
jgi:hypothetical protein